MASRSLGTLTLDLIAKIGGFTGPMDKAARNADKNAKQMARAAKEAREQWALFGKIALGAVTAIAGFSFARFISETRAAEQEQAQLAAVLRSTGEAAGFSQTALNEIADTLEAVSTFSGGEITEAQTALLAFTGIIGDNFTRALEAAVNMAARTGTSVAQAAETIGRALDVPSQGLTSLSKQGFRFTEDQKKVAAQLEATGRSAEAQGIILDALEESYGGAAEAARNTFGGSLESLNNTISYLLTGDDGSLSGATAAINELNSTLRDPATKEAVDSLIGSLAGLASGAVTVGREFTDLADKIAFTLADITAGIDPITELESEIRAIDKALSSSTFSKPIRFLFTSDEDLRKLREQKQLVLDTLSPPSLADSQADPLAPLSASLDSLISKSGLFGSGILDEQAILAEAEAIKKAEEAQKALNRAYDTQLERLKQQAALHGEVTELEQIRYAITQGNLVGINAEQQKRLEGLAAEIDALNAAAEAEMERARAEKQLASDYESVRSSLLTQEERLREAAQDRYEILENAFNAGLISEQKFAESVVRNTELLQEQIDQIKTKTSELDEFTKSAARSIQSELSNALVAGFEGGSQDLLKSWGRLLQRLIADAVAADLTRALFGDSGGGSGQYGTAQLIGGIASLFSGFYDSGGTIPSGKVGIVGEYGPELVSGPATVTGRRDTAAIMGGRNVSIGNLVFPGVTNAREAELAAGAAGRKIMSVVSNAQRYA